MNNSQKTITSALEELCEEFGISEADFGGKMKHDIKDSVILQDPPQEIESCPMMIQA